MKQFLPSCRVLLFSLGLVVAVSSAFSQSNSTAEQNVNRLMKQLRTGPLMSVTVNQLADLRAVEAIPLLKEKFAAESAKPSAREFPSDDVLAKAAVAGALVRLGAKETRYWEFLVDLAQVAVDSDAPFPILLDKDGNMQLQQLSPQFLAWAQSKNLPPDNTTARNLYYGLPLRLMPLAITGDGRGIPLLRKAMGSPNYFVQVKAAQGLVLAGDKGAIPLIIEASAKAPRDFSSAIACALVFFDDVRASSSAERFITDRAMLKDLREKSRTYGPRGMFK